MAEPAVPAATPESAHALLQAMRRTPMRRGAIPERRLRLRDTIADTIAGEGVFARLARRVAFQLVLKFEEGQLGHRTIWRSVGRQLRTEAEYLNAKVGLVDRQIIVALPKLSARHIEGLLNQLTASEPTIARTVLNVALDAADPPMAARRYLAEYRRVTAQLTTLDADIARTLANATFMARVPDRKALDHFKRFADLLTDFRDDVAFARTLARAACRAPDPVAAVRRLLVHHKMVLADLTSNGAEPHIARTLAAIALVSADPMTTAHKLLTNFHDVLRVVSRTHATVARSIALAACRAADPLSTAHAYMRNYDTIVRVIGQTDPGRAHTVASQAFRSHRPLRWATRYLNELRDAAAATETPRE